MKVINHYVYSLLEKEGLKRLPVPKNSKDSEELRTFVFASDDYLENEKLIVLIHGSGVVRAGQWARRLIINDNLNSGTQIPYVKRARELGYAVIVLNTNDNHRQMKGKQKEIKVRSFNIFYILKYEYIKLQIYSIAYYHTVFL